MDFSNWETLLETSEKTLIHELNEAPSVEVGEFLDEIDNNLKLFQNKYQDEKNVKSFQVSVLEITLSEIERLSPKLIDSAYCNGIQKKAF